jgi:creatinine amidohydrolase
MRGQDVLLCAIALPFYECYTSIASRQLSETERWESLRVRVRLIDEMTWPEVRDAAAADLPAVLAVGSTEQHGPHLPLATDTILPVGVALAAAERVPLVVAPPVRFGARSRALSGGGETFPGTLSVRGATLVATVSEVLMALARSGFSRLVLQNWHYENAGFLWEAADLAVERHPDIRVLVLESPMPPLSADELDALFPGGFPGWDVEHASIMETSMMMALRPDLVLEDRIVDDEAARHPSWDVVPAPDDFIPASGVLWHPSVSTPELGRRFVEVAAGQLADAIATEFPGAST